MASEPPTMHHSAAPQSTPRTGSRWTGTASSQYSSGPGSCKPDASLVVSPTRGPWAVSSFQDRSAITAPSPTTRQLPRIDAATAVRNGIHAARCATARSTAAWRIATIALDNLITAGYYRGRWTFDGNLRI